MILLTGFEPFGGAASNPSAEAAQRAAHELRAAGESAVAVVLPCTFGEATRHLKAAVRAYEPEAVLAAGVAGGRQRLSLERVAINLIDARIPDNAGAQPIDESSVPGAPAAYFTRLPIKRMVAQLEAAGLPAEVSHTAGTYVCNDTFFGLMHAVADRPEMAAGFVHVPEVGTVCPAPAEPGQVPTELYDGVWSVERIARGLSVVAREALAAARHPSGDLKVSAGTED
ncbi:pyroglutamyl-peptidase I [Zhihengliuella flava]|uniref:Pyroglutamyl-peptidase I n=1 Tax=Zhihengliuella flava TaxID=1285193 RepID=A0A931GKR0_9MICC|nr:pyroglutamyl-peptidase I [Zhihengliuella flava]MBG6083749.1 pyroglutamyl-peptidase [Zhihengliuella flava]